MGTQERVPHLLYPVTLQHVYPSAEDLLEFERHCPQVEQRELYARFKRQQHVHVAIGSEIISQDRPKQRELDDPPLKAKRLQLLHGQRNLNDRGC